MHHLLSNLLTAAKSSLLYGLLCVAVLLPSLLTCHCCCWARVRVSRQPGKVIVNWSLQVHHSVCKSKAAIYDRSPFLREKVYMLKSHRFLYSDDIHFLLC